jgi:hypothetical protein
MEAANDPPTLMQQAYVISKSLRSASYWLFALTFSLLFFSILAFISYITFSAEEVSNTTTIISLIILVLIAGYIVGWFIVKARHEYRRIRDWNEKYLHSSYTLIFDISVPKGNTTGEKVLSLAKFIFPELRDDFVVSIWDEPNTYAFINTLIQKVLRRSSKMTYNNDAIRKDVAVGAEILDIMLKTKVGYFIVKDFGNKRVTIEDINQLITACKKLKGTTPTTSIFRIICVAENYDEKLLERESLEGQMTEILQSHIKIDLLQVEINGYSVLWVS